MRKHAPAQHLCFLVWMFPDKEEGMGLLLSLSPPTGTMRVLASVFGVDLSSECETRDIWSSRWLF